MPIGKIDEQLPLIYLEVEQKPSIFDQWIKDGWEPEKKGPPLGSKSNLKLSTFLKDGETYVNGEEMLRRGIEDEPELGPLAGYKHAEYLFNNQHLIPAGYRGKVLVFAGTVWQDPRGYRCVVCLFWDGERWRLRRDWLGHADWHDYYRLVRLPQVSDT